MRRKIKAGLTSLSLPVIVYDTTSTTGGGLSGLTHTTSGLILEYRRQGQSSWTQLGVGTGLVSKTLGSYVSGGIVASGSRVGRYEIDIPDAAIAAGARMVEVCLRGAANMHPVDIEIELDAVDYQDATAFGLSRIDQTIGSRATQTSVDAIDDFVDTEVAAIKAKTDLIVAFPANFNLLVIDNSGSISRVTLVDELDAGALTANEAGAPIANIVWDEVLTGATHNIASSAGRRVRQLANVIVRAGAAQGPGTGNNQIQLDAGASATNGEYDPGLIFIETGTGAGQARLILQYNGSTKVATVDRDWRINPDNTSEFVILADAGRNSVNEGLAQGGSTTTITLNASASASDDAYNGQLVFIRSGTGQDQVGLVEDYVGSTKVATIRTRSATGQWATVPDATSAYMMIPNLTFTVSEIQSGLATSTALAAVATNVTALVNRIPETLFAGITSLAKWLGVLAGKTADATTRGEINLTPAGASYNETTDSLEAIRDVGGVGGGGAGGVTNITVEDRSITLE
jgi:hypothetical protein